MQHIQLLLFTSCGRCVIIYPSSSMRSMQHVWFLIKRNTVTDGTTQIQKALIIPLHYTRSQMSSPSVNKKSSITSFTYSSWLTMTCTPLGYDSITWCRYFHIISQCNVPIHFHWDYSSPFMNFLLTYSNMQLRTLA